MNKKIVTILIIGTTLFLNACKKNTDVFVPDAGQLNAADTVWSNSIAATAPVYALQNALVLQTVKDSIEVNANVALLTALNGVQVTFPPLCCVSTAGQIITGKVYVELLLIKKKGDMVLMNKPTISNGNVLVSGGEIFISLKKDGKELQLAPNVKIYIRYADAPTNQQMKLFLGDESNPAQFNWIPNTNLSDSLRIGPQTYDIAISHLRWINCDYFYDTAGITRSTVSAHLPANYTNANTTTFLVFKDFRSVLGMYPDVPLKRFSSGKVPNGKAATVVAISKQGNDYFLGKETITTGVNATTGNQKILINPVKASLADIKLFLSTL